MKGKRVRPKNTDISSVQLLRLLEGFESSYRSIASGNEDYVQGVHKGIQVAKDMLNFTLDLTKRSEV